MFKSLEHETLALLYRVQIKPRLSYYYHPLEVIERGLDNLLPISFRARTGLISMSMYVELGIMHDVYL